MTDEYILEKGYKQYNPTQFDNKHIVARFQKRFDDEYGSLLMKVKAKSWLKTQHSEN